MDESLSALVIVAALFIGAFWLGGGCYCQGYEDGQADAQRGIIRYELVKDSNGGEHVVEKASE